MARSLRQNSSYQLLLIGRTFSLTGTSMASLAGMLLAYEISHNTSTASIIASLGLIGMFATNLVAGVVADRYDRQKIMAVSSVLQMLLMASVPAAAMWASLTLWQLGVVVFLCGALSAFYTPAEQAAIKQIVAPGQLATAMAANQVRSSVANIGGPPLAGALYGLGSSVPFLGNAIANGIAAFCARLVHKDLRPPHKQTLTNASFRRELTAGIRFIYTHPTLKPLIAVLCLITLCFWIMYAGVTLALQQAGASATTVGFLQTAFGIGSFIGAAASGIALRYVPVGKAIIVAMFVLAIVSSAMLETTAAIPLTILMGLVGFIFPIINVSTLTYCMRTTPNALQGRMTSALTLMSLALGPIGNMAVGFLLDNVSRTWALLPGVIGITLACIIAASLKAIRTIPKLHDNAAPSDSN